LDLDEGERPSFSLNTSDDSDDGGNKEEIRDSTEGVNALRSIPNEDFMKMVAEFRASQKECDPNNPGMLNLCNEFGKILTKGNVGNIN